MTQKQESTASPIKESDTDLHIARKIQAAMIPRRLPTIEGVDMASLYLPCHAVGGDLFDVVQVSDDILAFIIFDVTGHGVSSALLSALAKVCFSNHVRTVSSPRAVIERVNSDFVKEVSADCYLTAFVGFLDLHDNTLTYSNAGHTYPLLYQKSTGSLIPLKTQGTFLGVFDNGFYEEQSIHLKAGDWMILFTDGAVTIFSELDAQKNRLIFEETLKAKIASNTPKELIDHMRNLYKVSNRSRDIDDDVTMIAVEMQTDSRRNKLKERLGFDVDEPVYLQFLSYFEDMDKATAAVLSSMDSFGYPDDSIRKMKVTLTELLVNAIHHGNYKDHTKKVVMGHVIDKRKAIVSIQDEGEGFNPTEIPDPTLPENLTKDCGRGLYIVRHYVDKVEFNEKGNRVTVTKYHSVN